MIDMRSYRDSTLNKRDDRSDDLHPWCDATGLAEARLRGLRRDLEGDCRRHADRPDQRGCHCARRRPAGAARARRCRSAVVHEARRHPQHVWLTADMHYTAAHHYDPNRAAFQDFEPFWEFVSGPYMRAPGARPARQYVRTESDAIQKGCSAEQGENLAPCFGLQFFGRVDIDGKTEVMTVTLTSTTATCGRSISSPSGRAARSDRGAAYLTRSPEDHRLNPSMFAPHSLASFAALTTRAIQNRIWKLRIIS